MRELVAVELAKRGLVVIAPGPQPGEVEVVDRARPVAAPGVLVRPRRTSSSVPR